MYCLLSGYPPFRGKSMAEVIHKVRYNEPVPVRRVAEDTPDELEQVITQLLSKSPDQRVPTARALSNRLMAILHALSINDGDLLSVTEPGDETKAGVREHMSEEEFAQLETAYEAPSGGGSSSAAVATPAVRPISKTASSAESGLPTHYTVVHEHRRQNLITDEVPNESLWSRVGVVACLLSLLTFLFLLAWQLRKPPTADQLYATISSTAEETPEQLIRSEDTVREFIMRFPEDERIGEINAIDRKIGLMRLESKLEVIARVGSPRTLAPVERATVKALKQEKLNTAEAAKTFDAIIKLFSKDENATLREQDCIELCKIHLADLRTQIQREQKTAIESPTERLGVAKALLATDDPEARKEARDLFESLIQIYKDDSWANELVDEARQLLREEFQQD